MKGNQELRIYFSLGQATDISHCQQLTNRDCGITCIPMVLRWPKNKLIWPRNNGNAAKTDTYDLSKPSADAAGVG